MVYQFLAPLPSNPFLLFIIILFLECNHYFRFIV